MRRNSYYVITVIVVLVLLTSLFYVIYTLSAGPPKRYLGAEQPTDPLPAPVKTPSNVSIDDKNLSDIAVVKELIIDGRLAEVPEGINMTRDEIINSYLYDCFYMVERSDNLRCTERYYENNVREYINGKAVCEAQDAKERSACLDTFYYDMARKELNIFCEGIQDLELRNECWTTII
jgi:hypothetical protein